MNSRSYTAIYDKESQEPQWVTINHVSPDTSTEALVVGAEVLHKPLDGSPERRCRIVRFVPEQDSSPRITEVFMLGIPIGEITVSTSDLFNI